MKKKNKITKSTAESLQLLHELQVHQLELELQNQALQESRAELEIALAHYRDLYDSALTGYFTFDNKGRITQTNLMGASFLGVDKSTLIAKHFVNFVAETERSLFNEFLKNVFTSQQKQRCKVILLNKGLSSIIVQIEAMIFNNGQECRAVVQNITELIQKEKLSHQLEFVQVARANSMGELASAIAHEINQPFCVIVNYINGCVRRLESDDYDISEIIDVMRLTTKQVELVGEIVHHMKNILRQDVTYYKPVSINEIAQAATSQIQKETHYDMTILLELELASNLPLVNADYIQIEVVILNLLRNGLESLYKTHIEKPKLILRTEHQKNMIMVSVINNGAHYSVEEEIHLFEPCFTTKKSGMGMGLSISRTIIEAHSGQLFAHKMPQHGVSFQFSLPIWKEDEF